ncbi:McrC family protein [Spirosoma sp. BT702]|uniref:McrC family protein n=1 Tax=Spirosoma profusum TaxID=2771354 RepID=A0A926XYW7_9BACT|nr:McrC family protein [Spirosoma profusum]MBD2700398.1 McrC family protein [Spirosoma profusum]
MPITYTVSENGLIGSIQQWHEPPPDGIQVPDEVFQTLRRFAFEVEQADALLTYSVQKNRELIRVRNYVGLLPLSNRAYLEILPKIEGVATSRTVLLKMLRRLRNSPFRMIRDTHTGATSLPLWEVFVGAFLTNAEVVLQQGVQRAYVAQEGNERFLRGKLQIARQLLENAFHAERLAVVYDTLTANVASNRILKTTLVYLKKTTISLANQRRIQLLLSLLDEVPPSESITADLKAVQRAGRLFSRYEQALIWAEALLSGQGMGVEMGRKMSLSLLFPMERVFEDYVAYGIRTYWPETHEVRIQESSAHLVDEHVGEPRFKLRPDIIVRHETQTFVLDTKWKEISGNVASGTSTVGTYGIEQADLYQLYAYGKKYDANNLFLIYPANATFREPLSVFGYDATTRLHVVPFDLTNSLVHEVEKLARYALSYQ